MNVFAKYLTDLTLGVWDYSQCYRWFHFFVKSFARQTEERIHCAARSVLALVCCHTV